MAVSIDEVRAEIAQARQELEQEVHDAIIVGLREFSERPAAFAHFPFTPATAVDTTTASPSVVFDTDQSGTAVPVQSVLNATDGQRGLVMHSPDGGAYFLPFGGVIGGGGGPGGITLADVIAYYESVVVTPDVDVSHVPTGNTHDTLALGDQAAQLIAGMPTVDTTDHTKATFFTTGNVTYLDVSNLLSNTGSGIGVGIFGDNPGDLSASRRGGLSFAVVYGATLGSADVTASAGTFHPTDVGMTLTENANPAFPVGTTIGSVLPDGSGATMTKVATATQATVVATLGQFTMIAPDYHLRADALYVGHASHVAARVATTGLDSTVAGSVTQITIPWTNDTTLSFPFNGTGSCMLIDESVSPKYKIWVYEYTVTSNDSIAGNIVLTVNFIGGGSSFQYAIGGAGDTVHVGLNMLRYDPKDQQFIRLVSNNTWNDTTTWFMDSYVPGPAGAIQIDGTNTFGPRWGSDNNTTGVGLNFSRTFKNQDGSNANANYLAQSFSDAFSASNASFNPRNVFDIVGNHVWAAFTNGRIVTGIYSGLSFENFLDSHYGGGNVAGTGYQAQVSIHNNVWASPASLGGRPVTVTLTQSSATVTATSGTFAATDVGAGIQGAGIPPGAKVKTFNSTTSVVLNVTAPISGSVAAQVGSYVDVSLGYDYGAGSSIGNGANADNSRDIPYCKVTASNQITAHTSGTYLTKNTNAFQKDDIGQGPGFNAFGGTWGYTVVDVSDDGATVTVDIDLPSGVGATGTLTLLNYWRRPDLGARRNIAARFAGVVEFYPTGDLTLSQPGSIVWNSRPEDTITSVGTHVYNYPFNTYVPFVSHRGTHVFVQGGMPFVASQVGVFDAAATYENFGFSTQPLPTQITFYAHNTFTAVGQAITIPDIRDFYSFPALAGTGGGTMSSTNDVTAFETALLIGAGATVGVRKGYEVDDATGSGTLTFQFGIVINALTKGASNVGISNASNTAFTPSTWTVTTAADSLDVAHGGTVVKVLPASNLTLTSTPTIPAGAAGQVLFVHNQGTSSVTLQDKAALPGSNLNLGTSVAIQPGQVLPLLYNATQGQWDSLMGAASTILDASGAVLQPMLRPPHPVHHANRRFTDALGATVYTNVSVIEVIVGDSLQDFWVGNNATDAENLSWPTLYEQFMANRFNSLARSSVNGSGCGWLYGLVPASAPYPQVLSWDHYNHPAATPGAISTAPQNDTGATGGGISITNGDSADVTRDGDGVVVYLSTGTVGGTGTITVVGPGGTSVTNITPTTATGTASCSARVYSIPAPGTPAVYGSLKVTVACTGGTRLDVDSIYFCAGNRQGGYQLHRATHGGWKLGGVAGNNGGGNPFATRTQFLQYLTNVKPQMVTIVLGNNDYHYDAITPTQYASRITALVAAIRTQYGASTLPAIRFVHEHDLPFSPANWSTDYRAAARAACESDGDIEFMDLGEIIGGYPNVPPAAYPSGTVSDPYGLVNTGDNLHPNAKAHIAMAYGIAAYTVSGSPTAGQMQQRFTNITGLPSGGGTFTITDPGGATPNSYGLRFYKLAGDAQPVFALGMFIGTSIFGMGAGGNAPLDVFMNRASAGTFNINDSVTSHGAVRLGVAAGGLTGIAILPNNNTTDQPTMYLFGSTIQFGGGGVNPSDFTITRPAGGGLQLATTTTQKLGFFGVTPVAARTGWGVPTAGTSRTVLAAGADLPTVVSHLAAVIVDLNAYGLLHS